jgi:hypothetical protein
VYTEHYIQAGFGVLQVRYTAEDFQWRQYGNVVIEYYRYVIPLCPVYLCSVTNLKLQLAVQPFKPENHTDSIDKYSSYIVGTDPLRTQQIREMQIILISNNNMK